MRAERRRHWHDRHGEQDVAYKRAEDSTGDDEFRLVYRVLTADGSPQFPRMGWLYVNSAHLDAMTRVWPGDGRTMVAAFRAEQRLETLTRAIGFVDDAPAGIVADKLGDDGRYADETWVRATFEVWGVRLLTELPVPFPYQCQTCNGSGMPGGVSGYRCPECDPAETTS